MRQGCDFGVDLKVPEMTDDPPATGGWRQSFWNLVAGFSPAAEHARIVGPIRQMRRVAGHEQLRNMLQCVIGDKGWPGAQ